MDSSVSEAEKSTLIIRLERNQKDLLQLRSTLSSYTCEPRTYSLYQSLEILRDGLDGLSAINSKIMVAIKVNENDSGLLERAKKLLIKFNQLQQDVEAYVDDARNS